MDADWLSEGPTLKIKLSQDEKEETLSKKLEWKDIQMRWYPPGTPLDKIPPCYAGHTYDNTQYGKHRAMEVLVGYRMRNPKVSIPQIVPHIPLWFDGKTVTGISGVWAFGWFDTEPESNELGEVSP